jgi:hypothetical protein
VAGDADRPPLIGALAGLFGLRGALFLLVGAALLIALLAGWIRQRDSTGVVVGGTRHPVSTRVAAGLPADEG